MASLAVKDKSVLPIIVEYSASEGVNVSVVPGVVESIGCSLVVPLAATKAKSEAAKTKRRNTAKAAPICML